MADILCFLPFGLSLQTLNKKSINQWAKILILSDSCLTAIQRHLYIFDTTTITKFSAISKGAGHNPKHSRGKRGGVKAHYVIRYVKRVPNFMDFTSAATYDIRTLKRLHLPVESLVVMDRAYIDYAEMERLTLEKAF